VHPPLPSQQPLRQHDPSEHTSSEHALPELPELELLELPVLVSPLLEPPLDPLAPLDPLVSPLPPLLDALLSHPSPEESHASVQQTDPHALG